jgi:solute carrier family 1 (neuronal/epithelial high affinity glutamate transporter), member 1
MANAKDRFILWGILIALVAGVVIGWYFPEGAQNLSFLGSLFFNALYLIIVPLIVASMVVGITALGDIRKLGRTARLAILYFMATSAVAVIIGIILAVIVQPGITGDNMAVAASGSGTDFSDMLAKIGGALTHTLNEMIPRNIIAAAAETKVLALIVFSLFFGGILSGMGPRAKPVIQFFEVFNDAIMKLVHLVMYLAPLGVLGIVASKVGEKAGDLGDAAAGIGMFSLVVLVGLLIHAGLLTFALKFLAGRNPWTYLANMGQAISTAVGVSSSSATLPVTMECVVEKNKVDQRAASFVLPLGTTINMDGTAMYQAISTIFICQMFGIALGIEQYVIMFITAILASVGAPGLPQAGIVMMTMVMGSVGVPPEIIAQGIGIILVVDWALDRGRTALNIYGDSVGAAVIANTFEFKTAVSQRQTSAKREGSRGRSTERRSSGGSDRAARSGNRSDRGDRSDRNDRNPRRKPRSTEHIERPSPESFGGAGSGAKKSFESASEPKTTQKRERVSQRAPMTEAEIESDRVMFAGMIKAPVFDLSAFETVETHGSLAPDLAQTEEHSESPDVFALDTSGADTADVESESDEFDFDRETDHEEAVVAEAAPEEVADEEKDIDETDSTLDADEDIAEVDGDQASDSPDSSSESSETATRFGRSPRRGG